MHWLLKQLIYLKPEQRLSFEIVYFDKDITQPYLRIEMFDRTLNSYEYRDIKVIDLEFAGDISFDLIANAIEKLQ